MDKETQMIVDKLDFFRDAIVHHDEYKTQDLIHYLAVAGDLIEELTDVKDRLAGMEIMLTSAQSAAETWRRRAEAAERDITPSCVYCKHSYLNRPGVGNCEYADALKCVGNAHFEWRGPCAENGGADHA